MRCRMAWPAAALALVLASACRPDVGADPAGYRHRVLAVLDPAGGVIPMPNDLVRAPDGRLAIPTTLATTDAAGEAATVPAFPEAMEEFVTGYLNTLDGFPSATPLTIAFSTAEVDTKTLSGSAVRVFDVTALQADPKAAVTEVTGLSYGALVEVPRAMGGSTWQTTVTPPASWTPGHTYMAFLLNTVRDTTSDANPIASPMLMGFLKSKDPLVAPDTCADAQTSGCKGGETYLPIPDADAAQLEAKRLVLKPLLDWFESSAPDASRIERKQAVLAWTFTITTAPEAAFDPATGRIPMPNDLARAAFPIPAGADCADAKTFDALPEAQRIQAAFFCWMKSLDGFSATSATTMAFSRALDPGVAKAGGVRVFDLTGATAAEVTTVSASFSDKTMNLTVAPGTPFQPGHRYAVAALTSLVSMEDDVPAAPSPVTAMLRLASPLVADGKSRLPGTLSDADAAALEPLRLAYAPVYDALAAAGVARGDVAGLATFTVSSANEALFDPVSGYVPFPNEILMDPATGLVSLPTSASMPPALLSVIESLNRLDGFGTQGSLAAPFAAGLDTSSLTLAGDLGNVGKVPIGMADITDVDPADMTTLAKLQIYGPDRVQASFANGSLVLAPPPGKPLPPSRRFMVVLFSSLKSVKIGDAAVRPIQPSPTFFLVRSPYPLVDADGKSALPQVLADADAARLEALRQAYRPMFEAMGLLGIGREDVLQFFTFRTASTYAPLQDLVAGLADAPEPWGGEPESATTVNAKLLFGKNPSDQIETVCLDCAFRARVLLPDPVLTDPANPRLGRFSFDADGEPQYSTDRKLRYLLTVPKGAGPFGLVVYLHGLEGDRTQVASVANDLAAIGYAALAVDMPYHGEHPIRVTGTDSGTGFFTSDVFAVRDNLREVALEQRQVLLFVRERLNGFLRTQLGLAAGAPDPIDPERVDFLGVSLGGIAGVVSTGVNPEFDRVVFVVAGGHLMRIFTETENTDFSAPLYEALAGQGLEPGTADFARFIDFAQWGLDQADPVNFARLASGVAGGTVDQRVLLIEAIGDEFIPNTTTEELRDALRQADGSAPVFRAFPANAEAADKLCHGFYVDGCDAAAYPKAAQARKDARQTVSEFLGQ